MDLRTLMIGIAWSTVAVTALLTLILHVQARRRPPTPPVLASYRKLSRFFRRASAIMGALFLVGLFTEAGEPLAMDYSLRVFLPMVLMCVVSWLGYSSLARVVERGGRP